MNISNSLQKCAVALTCAGACTANAAVTYLFTSGPVIALTSDVTNPVVTTYPPSAPPPPYEASLTLAAPLAANATTTINAEYAGFDLLPGAPQGGVLSFQASGFPILEPITSNFGDYSTGSSGDLTFIRYYSTVDGFVTTDVAGNITEWDLNFTLRLANRMGGGEAIICTGPACAVDVNVSTESFGIAITSAGPVPRTLNYVELNGVAGAGSIDINYFDTAFVAVDTLQRSFTGAPGTWDVSGAPVSTPGTLALGLLGIGLLLRKRA